MSGDTFFVIMGKGIAVGIHWFEAEATAKLPMIQSITIIICPKWL